MPEVSDRKYLLQEQYKNASNLNARVELHRRFSTSKAHWQHWVFEQFATAANSRILELGCGPAHLWRDNIERIPAGWDITLSDFSAGMLAEAQRNLEGSAHTFRFRVIDAQTIPFESESLDVVIANHMLYHVPDRARALGEIQRVLKKGGRLYAATNGQNHLWEISDLIRRVSPEYDYDLEVRGSFTLGSGQRELAQFFEPVTVHLYEGDLEVTESEPLIEYMLSSFAKAALTEEKVQTIREIVEQEIAERGAFHITRSTGLFEAVC